MLQIIQAKKINHKNTTRSNTFIPKYSFNKIKKYLK